MLEIESLFNLQTVFNFN